MAGSCIIHIKPISSRQHKTFDKLKKYRYKDSMTPRQALRKAINFAGSPAAFARLLDTSPQLVHYWIKKGRVPAERAPEIEAKTPVRRHELRPDLWQKESTA